MPLTHVQLRKKYADFWKKNGHKEIPAIPLVPQNDPTTLFTGSGMQQLVPYLLGEPHPLGKRVFDIQPCFRSQDIDEVGDNRHTTFFEMMGNWSLGDYFKKEQLSWFWKFLTDELKLPKEKLYVTVFAGDKKNNLPPDDESIRVWKELGIPENKIFQYGAEKNWWSRAGIPDNMPPGEPGGPDSEVFYEFTQIPHDKKFGEKCHPNCDCGRFLEIGNSVFMQYKKNPDGTFSDLPAMNVDFGGGLERILAASNNDPDVFKIDIFKDLYAFMKSLIKDSSKKEELRKIRVFLDHSRATLLLINSGVNPGKNDRESVLRRIIKRANSHFDLLNTKVNIYDIWKQAINHFYSKYKDVYVMDVDSILKVIQEELSLQKNIFVEMKIMRDKIFRVVPLQSNISTASQYVGNIVFEYQTSHGVPFEYSKLIIEDLKDKVNPDIVNETYKKSMIKHQSVSKAGIAKKFKGGLADQSKQTIKYHTATHLLHQALFDAIGDSIRQEGSNITGERFRFDFYSITKPTEEQIKEVEKIINDKIKESLPVEFKIVPKEEALKLGAKSFFREKYPDMVKVYFIGNYSKEFCGGPHVKNTSEIGQVKIYKFEKIGSNLYRIYAK
jgi:alanyl-tRNA synthetase